MSKLDLKPIQELLGKQFIIPDYQRGYKWTSTEVSYLLNDIKEYFEDHTGKESFYCLQPLVVCQSEIDKTKWEVIDGQQRLTTIHILLNNLKSEYEKLYNKELENYSIEYVTRKGSKDFLDCEDISKAKKSEYEKNVDQYNMYNADKVIKEIFGEIDNKEVLKWTKEDKENLLRYLTNDRGTGENVKFIWFDVTEEINNKKVSSKQIFERLNVGKIPLTNAELIKALFLSESNIKKELDGKETSINQELCKEIQTKIALDWDRIERKLQMNEFWYFIYGNGTFEYSTRIEFLFDLIKNNIGKKEEREDRYTFNCYYKDFKNGNDNSRKAWEKVLDKFNQLENWYEDRVLYHLVGYNTAVGHDIQEMFSLLEESKSNSDFRQKLLDKTKDNNKINVNARYKDGKVKSTLLLFNVLSMLNNKSSEERFPFHFYHEEDWDIEHVTPQTDQDIKGADRKNWILTNLSYLTGIELPLKHATSHFNKYIEDVKVFLENQSKEQKEEKRDELIKEFINLSDHIEDSKKAQEIQIKLQTKLKDYLFDGKYNEIKDKDDISNLVLLDASTNRMYKNAFFPVKRKWIITRAKQGIFIPPCTRNVFMKAYSNNFSQLSAWTEEDAEDYKEEVCNIIGYYVIDGDEE